MKLTWCCFVLVSVVVTFLASWPTTEAVPLQNSNHPSQPVVANGQSAAAQKLNDDALWEEFKKAHRAHGYISKDEETKRKANFDQNLKTIQDHNDNYAKGLTTFTMGVNQFSDMTVDEFSHTMNGHKDNKKTLLGLTPSFPSSSISSTQISTSPTPSPYHSVVDWRTLGYVTKVKNQGQCGSCWSFSTTGVLEGQIFRSTHKLVSLSEQNLIDCSSSFGNQGCDGGMPIHAYNYIKNNSGIDTESSYSYKGVLGTCHYSAVNRSAGTNITGYVKLPVGDESALQQAVTNIGPISIAIDASHASFQHYQSGIYNEPSCTTTLDHAVLVVGYGSSNGNNYWIVKNSWGTSWGQAGYVYMSKDLNNQCGIAQYATYPTL